MNSLPQSAPWGYGSRLKAGTTAECVDASHDDKTMAACEAAVGWAKALPCCVSNLS
ncbi:hypothetical protein BRAS3809_1960001 [Bradyrhizobium sp. STM 3809]|nr:hypothetical protein BRAS3809_1960001 [Bradyrhizobium sp. STM 3809]